MGTGSSRVTRGLQVPFSPSVCAPQNSARTSSSKDFLILDVLNEARGLVLLGDFAEAAGTFSSSRFLRREGLSLDPLAHDQVVDHNAHVHGKAGKGLQSHQLQLGRHRLGASRPGERAGQIGPR